MSWGIVLADDHKLVRAGIIALLEEVVDFRVLGEASDGDQVLSLCRNLRPDVLLLDLAMPGRSGLQVLGDLQALEPPRPRVLMLSMHASEAHVQRCLSLGADGYVLKNSAPEELEQAIRQVLLGQRWWPPAVPAPAVLPEPSPAVRAAALGLAELTPRQLEVLKLLADGLSTKEVAQQLGISPKTVETYRAQLMQRLGVQDLVGLVRFALFNGISSYP